MNHLVRTIGILAILTMAPAANIRAGVIGANSYAEGLAAAKTNNAVLIVLVHGSDWNQWGETLQEHIFESKSFEQSFAKDTVVVTDVDILQSPDDAKKKKNDERNKGWKGKGVHTYPAVCAYLPGGTLLGTRQGESLPKSLTKARTAINDLVTSCLRYSKLKDAAANAQKSKDTKAELQALAQLGKLPLTRPAKLLDRIKELDPDHLSGHYAQLSFPHWNKLFLDATNRAKNGEGPAVEAELNKMLQSKAYSTEQIALIYVAIGSCHRQQGGHEKQAAEAFKKAVQLTPDSFGGQVAQRIYTAWYKEEKK